MDVMNRFQGLSLVDRVPEDLWMKVYNIVQKAVTKTIPKKKECKKTKLFLKQLRKEVKYKRKRKEIPIECRILDNSKES